MASSVNDTKSKISAIYSTKKHGQDKYGKTHKKLPDLSVGHQYDGVPKGRNIGFASDSDEQKMVSLKFFITDYECVLR